MLRAWLLACQRVQEVAHHDAVVLLGTADCDAVLVNLCQPAENTQPVISSLPMVPRQLKTRVACYVDLEQGSRSSGYVETVDAGAPNTLLDPWTHKTLVQAART